jgi:ATP-dependent 26S proteasome regulatory subunit
MINQVATTQDMININEQVYVPMNDPNFVRWGHYKDIENIIKSDMFYPVFITGMSGNGKTMMVEQACARLKKNYIRVQISPETDEDDLIGGFRLVNGQTVFAEGPVIRAMKTGALLLIDEIDRGSNRIMCLQGVLEGKPVLIKKTGEIVRPLKGFNIIATANTKGKGSDDGRFIAATIIDEAFLERFTITIEQPYPTSSVEKRILLKHMEKYGKIDEEFASRLTMWSEGIRKTFVDGGIDELISTRRLCHIAQTFAIFEDRVKAIELCTSRFDDDTKTAFVDLYTKIDSPGVDTEVVTPDNTTSDIQF